MMGAPRELMGHEDPHILERYARALAGTDDAGRRFLREFMALCTDIEKDMAGIRATMRNCNVIMARIVDTAVRFEAGGMPN